MRLALLAALAVALSGCGTRPINAELYALAVDYFRAPATCYTDGMQPANGLASAPPHVFRVEVWDGPDGTALLEVVDGALSVDMGDAANVGVTGLFTGTFGADGWVFASQQVDVNRAAGGTTVTDTTSAQLTFRRESTFKGTAALSSSRTCTGTGCPATLPSCTATGIGVTGTRLAVDWQTSP
jgi:hypothetical protein